MKQKKTFLILLFLLMEVSLFAQNSKEEFLTFNEELAIGIKGDSIAVYALIAAGKEAKETVILLHGIPGNEKNLDLAQDLRKTGKNVIFFSYRGTWGSQGTYRYSNCLEDLSAVLHFFSDSSISRKMRIDTSRFTLIGHSLGGGLALIQGANDPRVKKIIAISAANFGYRWKDLKTADSLLGFQNYIRSSFVLKCNPKEFLQEIIDKAPEYDALTYTSKLAVKKVLVIDDFDRSDSWPGELKSIAEYEVIESDHSFTNKRKDLSDFIITWLEKN